jgi:hypothetical protein
MRRAGVTPTHDNYRRPGKQQHSRDMSRPRHTRELLIVRLSVSDSLLVTYGHDGTGADGNQCH